jgi:tRNA G10  N-methylase Trm11
MGQVKKNDLTLDPFAGTGSLLLPPAFFGYINMYLS